MTSQEVFGQRVIREMESNIDTGQFASNDSVDQSKKKKKIVPTEVISWVIDPVYGTRTPVDVDTLQHEFQNKAYGEGLHGEYNTLGNLGSPRETRLFMDRTMHAHDFLPIATMSQAIEQPSDYRHFNTKSPYMNLSYDWCGTKTTGYDNFKALYTNNAGKRFNFGGIFHYMYGQGYYDNQHTSFLNGTGWASYVNDNYDLHLHYSHYDMKMEENGGITDEAYITNPESMARSYGSDDIPTRLNNTWSRQHHDILTLNHRYHLGFTRVEGDSTNAHDVFVPVTSIFHSFELGSYRRRMISYDKWQDFYNYNYLPGDTLNNKHSLFTVSNRLGLTLHEGFNKYAVAGLSAYAGFVHRNYEMPDTVADAATTQMVKSSFKENDILIGGRIFRHQGTYIHYDATAEFVVAGDNAGDLNVNGHGELNLPVLGDTAQVALDGFFTMAKLNLYYEHFHSKNLWWDRDLDKETRLKLSGTLSYPKTKTSLFFGVENVTNYTYMKNTGLESLNKSNESFISHNVGVSQESSVQVMMARLQQRVDLKFFHIEADVAWQTSTKKEVLPLPTLSIYANAYFNFVLAKVLKVELGGNMKFFTKYEAPDYDPLTGQFILQNDATKEKVGGYPLMSVYANLALKKLRFHLTYYHVNQSDGHYFTMPRYPMNPGGLRFGISWNFYD